MGKPNPSDLTIESLRGGKIVISFIPFTLTLRYFSSSLLEVGGQQKRVLYGAGLFYCGLHLVL